MTAHHLCSFVSLAMCLLPTACDGAKNGCQSSNPYLYQGLCYVTCPEGTVASADICEQECSEGTECGSTSSSSGSTSSETSTSSTSESGSSTTEPAESSSTSSAATTSSTSEGSESGVPPNGYGDCINHPEAEACIGDEICFGAEGVPGFCTLACTEASECTVPNTGDAPPMCALFGPGGGLCYLDCSGGQACPDGMDCDDGICVWQPEGGVVPDAWTCDNAAYDAGDGCDCGCAVVDPDCATDGVASCDTCSLPGACSEDECPGMIDPQNNAVCGP